MAPNELQLHPQDRAVAVGGELDVIDVPAPVSRRSEVLTAGFDPLDGFADAHGDEAHQGLFRVDVELASETAADLRRNDTQAVLRYAEHQRHQRADQVRNLCGGVDCERLVAGFPIGHDTAGFHRAGDQALADDAFFDDDLGSGECVIDVASVLPWSTCALVMLTGLTCRLQYYDHPVRY